MAQKKEAVIQVRNLYKIYRIGENRVKALNGVSLNIYRGEFCSIVGPSGSGKTTLGKVVAKQLGIAFIDIDDFIEKFFAFN